MEVRMLAIDEVQGRHIHLIDKASTPDGWRVVYALCMTAGTLGGSAEYVNDGYVECATCVGNFMRTALAQQNIGVGTGLYVYKRG